MPSLPFNGQSIAAWSVNYWCQIKFTFELWVCVCVCKLPQIHVSRAISTQFTELYLYVHCAWKYKWLDFVERLLFLIHFALFSQSVWHLKWFTCERLVFFLSPFDLNIYNLFIFLALNWKRAISIYAEVVRLLLACLWVLRQPSTCSVHGIFRCAVFFSFICRLIVCITWSFSINTQVVFDNLNK